MNIKFIYFDVGGVVIKDFSKTNKWNEMLESLGVDEQVKPRFEEFFDLEEPKYCSGEKDTESFVPIMKNELGLAMPDGYSFLEDFVNRFEVNPTMKELIEQLRERYKVGLLTNMYPGMLDMIQGKGLLPHIDWDAIIDSSVVGFIKPQKEIFSIALGLAGYPANEVLFVENSKMHIEAAAELGWNTFLYNPADIPMSNKGLLEALSK